MSEQASPWTDLRAYVALPRLTDLLTGPGGEVVVATASLNADGTGYRSAWWQLDPGGGAPRVLTRSLEGEGAAAFLPDGRFVFTSERPALARPAAEAAKGEERRGLWCLPTGGGEAYELTSRDGGWSSVTAAREGSRIVLGAELMPAATTVAEDEAARRERREYQVTALLHESAAVRHWDHDLGPGQPRLVTAELADLPVPGAAAGGALKPDRLRVLTTPGRALDSEPYLDEAGRWAVVSWAVPGPRGVVRTSVALLDLEQPDAEPRILAAADDEHDFDSARISADGRLVACVRRWRGTAEEPSDQRLHLVDVATGEGAVLAGDWDRWPRPETFSADGSLLYVTVDENGQAPVYAVRVDDGRRHRLTDLGSHTSVRLSHDGGTLYALRSDYSDPGSVVGVDLVTGVSTVLPRPVDYPTPPGRMENVEVYAADGARVRGFLMTPVTAARSAPAPLVLWAHGGPFSSWNCWSWRWCPWLLVAQGYAVLLPDPALSTGYGRAMIARGWTDWGDTPYSDLMTITDLVAQRPDIDGERTAAMGGSFGGYLVNWIAGHTDRFDCLVSHAGLWDLESFIRTTDHPWAWEIELTPEHRQQSSPAAFADEITTPMLVVHGDRDYRVPVSEGLALWRDLVSRHDGPPEELPHKFLYFPEENHWVLSPQHAVVWYEAVLSFLDTHLRGGNFTRPAAL